MFDYRFTVTSSDGFEWGLFKTRIQAVLMRDALKAKFDQVTYEVTEVK